MANPSWSLDNITFTSFRGKFRFGGRPYTLQDADIVLETDNGVEFVYNLFRRSMPEITFRFLASELTSFRDFHNAVGGQSTPFYFSLSGVGSADSLYVRKEAGFDPQELDSPGGPGAVYDYVLKMREALT